MQVQNKKLTDAEFDAVWKKIDTDDSDDISVKELAKFYGFDLNAQGQVVADDDDLDDDAILEALLVRVFSDWPNTAPRHPPLQQHSPPRAEGQGAGFGVLHGDARREEQLGVRAIQSVPIVGRCA